MMEKIERLYEIALQKVLDFPKTVVITVIALFVQCIVNTFFSWR